jgi:phenylacetate-CoA ligase
MIKYISFLFIDIFQKTNILKKYLLIKKLVKKNHRDIQNWQTIELKKIVAHFYYHSSFYRSLMNSNNLTPDSIQKISDIEKLPILTKNDYHKYNFEDIIPQNIKSIRYKKNYTGGSTGDPLSYLIDYNSLSMNIAFSVWGWENHGYKFGYNHIALGGSSINPDYSPSLKSKLFNKVRGKYL